MKKVILILALIVINCTSEEEWKQVHVIKQQFEDKMEIKKSSVDCLEGRDTGSIGCDAITTRGEPVKYRCNYKFCTFLWTER